MWNHLSSCHAAAADDGDDGGGVSQSVGVPVLGAASLTLTVAGSYLVSHRLSQPPDDHHAGHAPLHDLGHCVAPVLAVLYRHLSTENRDCLMQYVLNDCPSSRGHSQLKKQMAV